MKFLWSTIIVRDMDESIKFYQDVVGLKLNRRYSRGPEAEFAFLGVGETEVELIHRPPTKDSPFGENISLGFSVDNLDDKIAFIKGKGLSVYAGPIQPSDKIRFFYVLDPNGLKIQFVELKA